MKKKTPRSQQDRIADKKQDFLEYFKTTPIQKFAAAYVGVCEDTVGDWKKNDPDFSDCIDRAKAEYVKKELNLVRSREWKLERIFKGDFAQRTETDITSGGEKLPSPILKLEDVRRNDSDPKDQGTN